MLKDLNLSTHPFRNRTTPYLLAAIIAFMALIGFALLYSKLNENEKLNALAAGQIKEMRDEVAKLKGEGEKVQQQLTPQQRELLVASHKLVDNKTFAWSRLFYDLETVIPGSVSASRIVVHNVYRDGDRVKAQLELTVLSRDYQSVVTMINSMNGSGNFNAELRSQNLQTNQRMTFSEFSLNLIYTPPYGVNPNAGEVARAEQGGGQ